MDNPTNETTNETEETPVSPATEKRLRREALEKERRILLEEIDMMDEESDDYFSNFHDLDDRVEEIDVELDDLHPGQFRGPRGETVEHVDNYQFEIEERPLEVTIGDGETTETAYQKIVVPDKRAIVRLDTNQVVGVVGNNYKVLSHADALDPILENLDKRGIDTFKRVLVVGDGARMFANIYFPNMVKSIRNAGTGTDEFWPGINVVNSLDGSLKYMAEATIYRLACTNGMRIPTKIAGFTAVHSKNTNYTNLVDGIMDSVSDEKKFAQFQLWGSKVLTNERMHNLADLILNDKDCTFPSRYSDLVHAEIENECMYGVISLWGLYNAFNSVLEHFLVREKGRYDRSRLLDANVYKVFLKHTDKVMEDSDNAI